MDDLERARALLRDAATLYRPWKTDCEARVARWEWGTFKLYSLEPCYFELHKFTRGQPLRGPRLGAEGHGFDSSGKLLVTRSQTEFRGRFSEEFVQYFDDHWEVLQFESHADKKVQRADVYRLEGGRVGRISTAASNGNWFLNSFRYDDFGRLVELERTGNNGPQDLLHDFRDLEYDSAGTVVRVCWRFPDGRKVIDFERPSEAESFPSLRDELLGATSQAILELLRGLQLDSPAYAVALIWCDAAYQHLIPPSVKVGVTSERQRFIDESGHKKANEWFPRSPAELKWLLWNPAEWRWFLRNPPQWKWLLWNPAEWKLGGVPLLPKEASRKAELANQDIWQRERFRETEDFFRQLAADLSRLDLPIPKTDDFVCYASNIDLDRGIDDVRRQAPKQVLNLLRKRALL